MSVLVSAVVPAEVIRVLGEGGAAQRLGEHLAYSVLAVAIAAVIAVPLGLLIGHTGRGAAAVTVVANACRALPSLGLMTFLVLVMGLGLAPPVLCLVILALPELLAGVYSGVASVDRNTVEAARAVGMTETQVLTKVEIPIGMPIMVAGLRGAALQVIATATIAAYVNLGGLGRYLFDGLAVYDYAQVAWGAALVSVLALGVDAALGAWMRATAPGARPAKDLEPDLERRVARARTARS